MDENEYITDMTVYTTFPYTINNNDYIMEVTVYTMLLYTINTCAPSPTSLTAQASVTCGDDTILPVSLYLILNSYHLQIYILLS